jgi:hypothetical protein
MTFRFIYITPTLTVDETPIVDTTAQTAWCNE